MYRTRKAGVMVTNKTTAMRSRLNYLVNWSARIEQAKLVKKREPTKTETVIRL